MKLHKNCTGCTLANFTCLLKYDYKLVCKCPCRNCLIKMVCRTRCNERINLFDLLPKSKKEELTNIDLVSLKKQLKANKIDGEVNEKPKEQHI